MNTRRARDVQIPDNERKRRRRWYTVVYFGIDRDRVCGRASPRVYSPGAKYLCLLLREVGGVVGGFFGYVNIVRVGFG